MAVKKCDEVTDQLDESAEAADTSRASEPWTRQYTNKHGFKSSSKYASRKNFPSCGKDNL